MNWGEGTNSLKFSSPLRVKAFHTCELYQQVYNKKKHVEPEEQMCKIKIQFSKLIRPKWAELFWVNFWRNINKFSITSFAVKISSLHLIIISSHHLKFDWRIVEKTPPNFSSDHQTLFCLSWGKFIWKTPSFITEEPIFWTEKKKCNYIFINTFGMQKNLNKTF